MTPRRSRTGVSGSMYEDVCRARRRAKTHLASPNSRDRVRGIIPLFHKLRDLGASVIDGEDRKGCRAPIAFSSIC
jgi:hypothetical protein